MADLNKHDLERMVAIFARSEANAKTQAETVGWLDATPEAKAVVAAVHAQVAELYRAALENTFVYQSADAEKDKNA